VERWESFPGGERATLVTYSSEDEYVILTKKRAKNEKE